VEGFLLSEIIESTEPAVEPIALGPVKTLDLPDEHVLAVDSEKRILALRVVRYNEVVDHPAYGRMLFLPGAFAPVEPSRVRLRSDHEDPPTGVGTAYQEDPVGPIIPFRVSKTQRGDDQLTLARDGVSRGTSPGFMDIPGKPQQQLVDGKITTVYGPGSAVLAEVSTTWAPTFPGDGVVYMLHSEQKGSGQMAEQPLEAAAVAATVITPGIDYEAMASAIVSAQAKGASESKLETLLVKFDQMVELQRAQFHVPTGTPRKAKLNDWVEITLRRLRGEAIPASQLKELALDDVVTTEQPGLVPNLLVPDYNDIITPQRPFLNSTRKIAAPASGTSMLLPIITTRAVAGTQAGPAEKGALTTTATKVGTGTFAYEAVFGGADISIQMIQRADRSFFDLLTGDMGFAYALDCEKKALAALLAGYTDSASVAHTIVNGGNIDPESPNFGEAWKVSILAAKRAPTHAWMSAAAVGAFIDAKAPMTNAPLYSNLAAAFTAGGGPGGRLSGLIPVYVPAMDANLKVDVIVGPADGFVWAEDPALNLQADVPSVAGRDIALVGGIFPAPRYANAFTKYNIATS
jgi:phage head maturation protease